jgi:hypothetical protein
MSQLIENQKNYTGEQTAEVFFRPSFTGENAVALGLRVLFNTPVNTTLNFWSRRENILKKYAEGWQGGDSAKKYQKTIVMEKVKAEQAFQPSEYFSTVYEKITNTPGVNLQDLTGTDLANAEEALFRQAIAEDTRVTMWVGDKAKGVSDYDLFDGLIVKASTYEKTKKVSLASAPTDKTIKAALDSVWKAAPAALKALKSSGKLVYFVTEDVYDAYESFLDASTNNVAYNEMQMGRSVLNYHGVEVHKMEIDSHLKTSQSIIILSHKDNLVLALNTTSLPEAGARMWYNPDEMQNRQRVCFLAGTEILDDEIVVYASTSAE